MKKVCRWVVKAGSTMVCEGGPLLMRVWMHQVRELQQKFGIEVIWVTSGAIALATEETQFRKDKRTLPEKQALSAIGQPLIMDQYNLALHATGLRGSQVLLTASDIENPARRKNLQNTLQQLLRWRVIPILNENDAVSTDEIQFGDNDSLASQVAVMMKAKRLILLTDVDGLYSDDPKNNSKAELISYLPKILASDLRLAPAKAKSARGTGGMYSKLLAAQRASKAQIPTHLVRGDISGNLIRIAEGRSIGTQIGGRRGS